MPFEPTRSANSNRCWVGLAVVALAASMAVGCRKHSWETNSGQLPAGLQALGIELDASAVAKQRPMGDAAEAANLFFRRPHNGVAVDYTKHFEAKGFRRVSCAPHGTDASTINECFRSDQQSVRVRVKKRDFPLLGTALKRPMAEVSIYLNPKFLQSDS